MLAGADHDAKSVGRVLALNATLRTELDRITPVIEDRIRPMAREERIARLIKHAVALGVPDQGVETLTLLLAPYLEALATLSSEMLEDAFRRWNRAELYPEEPGRHAFFQKPAEIFKLAEKSRLELGQVAYRAREGRRHAASRPPPEPSLEERRARRQDLIDQGLMDENGKVIFDLKRPPAGFRPSDQRAAAAQRIREIDPDDDAAGEAV